MMNQGTEYKDVGWDNDPVYIKGKLSDREVVAFSDSYRYVMECLDDNTEDICGAKRPNVSMLCVAPPLHDCPHIGMSYDLFNVCHLGIARIESASNNLNDYEKITSMPVTPKLWQDWWFGLK